MSRIGSIMKKILVIQRRLVSQKPKRGRCPGLERVNQLMSNIRGVGLIEEMKINGSEGRYLIIDGRSWQRACRGLKMSTAPSFIMWEESEFLSFLESDLVAAGAEDGASGPAR